MRPWPREGRGTAAAGEEPIGPTRPGQVPTDGHQGGAGLQIGAGWSSRGHLASSTRRPGPLHAQISRCRAGSRWPSLAWWSDVRNGRSRRPATGHRSRQKPGGSALVNDGQRPAPTEFAVVELVGHITDAELVSSGRYRWILAHDAPSIPAYDRDLWVERLATGGQTRRTSSRSSERSGPQIPPCGVGRPRRIDHGPGSTPSAARRATS